MRNFFTLKGHVHFFENGVADQENLRSSALAYNYMKGSSTQYSQDIKILLKCMKHILLNVQINLNESIRD